MRRGHHPFIRAMYGNGFNKDVALNNYNEKEIMVALNRVRTNCNIF